MELAQYILTGLLYIIIYGFSTLFIFQFLLDISIAFEKHCNCTTSTKHSVIKTETLAEKSEIQISNKNKNQVSTTKQMTVQHLRKRCSQAGIKWSYAIVTEGIDLRLTTSVGSILTLLLTGLGKSSTLQAEKCRFKSDQYPLSEAISNHLLKDCVYASTKNFLARKQAQHKIPKQLRMESINLFVDSILNRIEHIAETRFVLSFTR